MRQFLVDEFYFPTVFKGFDPLFVWHVRIFIRRDQGTSPVYVVRLIRNYSSDFLATTRPALPSSMHLGYTDSARGDGSKAGTLLQQWRKTLPIERSSWECHRRARCKWAWLERVIADHKTCLNNGNLRVQGGGVSAPAADSYSLNSDRKESSSIWLSGASQ